MNDTGDRVGRLLGAFLPWQWGGDGGSRRKTGAAGRAETPRQSVGTPGMRPLTERPPAPCGLAAHAPPLRGAALIGGEAAQWLLLANSVANFYPMAESLVLKYRVKRTAGTPEWGV